MVKWYGSGMDNLIVVSFDPHLHNRTLVGGVMALRSLCCMQEPSPCNAWHCTHALYLVYMPHTWAYTFGTWHCTHIALGMCMCVQCICGTLATYHVYSPHYMALCPPELEYKGTKVLVLLFVLYFVPGGSPMHASSSGEFWCL